jgi:hypothetical protein
VIGGQQVGDRAVGAQDAVHKQLQLFLLCFLLLTAQSLLLRPSAPRRIRTNSGQLQAPTTCTALKSESDSTGGSVIGELVQNGNYAQAFTVLKKEPLSPISFGDAVSLCTTYSNAT